MSRNQTIERFLSSTPDADAFDCRERVEVFFVPESFSETGEPSREGEWQWQYTLETENGSYINRRVGTTGLNNPRIRVDQLHRALCHDRSLGIFVPKTSTWFNPLEGNVESGWAFVQKQKLQRAQGIERKVAQFLEAQ